MGTISSTGARTFKKPVRAIVLRALFRLQRVGFFATLIIATVQAQAQQPKLDVIVIGVVTLRQVPEGKTASARVVANPADYANVPELEVMKMGRAKTAGTAAVLGIIFETPDGGERRDFSCGTNRRF